MIDFLIYFSTDYIAYFQSFNLFLITINCIFPTRSVEKRTMIIHSLSLYLYFYFVLW